MRILTHIALIFTLINCSLQEYDTSSSSDNSESNDVNSGPIDGSKQHWIFPGTKWCGQGNIATHEEDYGVFIETDKCCKSHDFCPDFIASGESKYGLTNNGLFTKVHCDCDMMFHSCLKEANTFVSQKVGATYFDILGSECFKLEYPIVQCSRHSEIVTSRCLEYELDMTQPKEWQFFDNPLY